jgi:Actinobacteria/chloroflexi VLRF1 release factor
VAQAHIVDIGPERLERWLRGFAERHGEVRHFVVGDALHVEAADGATASFEAPFPPLPDGWAADDPVARFIDHALRPRVLGVLLVRLGGYAVGVFDGDELVASKVGSRQVHGRSAAGGWSQQRFARRREGQVKVALDAAILTAAAVLRPHASRLDAVVTGGDRVALRTVLADPRLSALQPKVSARILDVPDPKLRVLRASLPACRAVKVTVAEQA